MNEQLQPGAPPQPCAEPPFRERPRREGVTIGRSRRVTEEEEIARNAGGAGMGAPFPPEQRRRGGGHGGERAFQGAPPSQATPDLTSPSRPGLMSQG